MKVRLINDEKINIKINELFFLKIDLKKFVLVFDDWFQKTYHDYLSQNLNLFENL